jgi:hypothetical protein
MTHQLSYMFPFPAHVFIVFKIILTNTASVMLGISFTNTHSLFSLILIFMFFSMPHVLYILLYTYISFLSLPHTCRKEMGMTVRVVHTVILTCVSQFKFSTHSFDVAPSPGAREG